MNSTSLKGGHIIFSLFLLEGNAILPMKVSGRGKIYRETYFETNMKLRLLNIYKVNFGASKSQITRFKAVQNKPAVQAAGADPFL